MKILFTAIILEMTQDTENELENLEGYLVGLDELVGNVTSEWATTSPETRNSGVKEVHKALQDLLQESLEFAKESNNKKC